MKKWKKIYTCSYNTIIENIIDWFDFISSIILILESILTVFIVEIIEFSN